MSLGIKYDANHDSLFRMPENIMPPLSAYRFNPDSNLHCKTRE